MVSIVNYKKHQTEDGRDFLVLVVQGGIELVRSQQTQRFYATVRKTTIPTTFDEETCLSLIGTELPGSIQKVDSEPYEYTVKETGEVLTLNHKWEYNPEDVSPVVEKSETTLDEFVSVSAEQSFSLNGVE